MLRSPMAWAGLLAIVVGLVWLFQGIGLLGGSAMTGATTWAIVGLLVAAMGVGLMAAARRRTRP